MSQKSRSSINMNAEKANTKNTSFNLTSKCNIRYIYHSYFVDFVD